MKDIFLVKINPDISDENNWNPMTMTEFADFLDTPEGLQRARFFQRLSRCSEDDYGIIIECPEEQAEEIAKERRHARYLLRQKRKAQITLLSLMTPASDDDPDETYGDIIPADIDVEKAAITRVLLEKLYVCLMLLPTEDLDLIANLYLRDNPLSAIEYGKKCNCSTSAIYKRRDEIFRDLRVMLKYNAPEKEESL